MSSTGLAEMFFRSIKVIINKVRKLKYSFLSENMNIDGYHVQYQPVLFKGSGLIQFKGNVCLGWPDSPFFFSGYSYIEARNPGTKIIINDGTMINNSVIIIGAGEGISIGENVLIGYNCEIIDSDFHDLSPNPEKRKNGNIKTKKVVIENNVFIGNNCSILKGVTIGENSVIANSSVVVRSIPPNVIAAGNPCKIVRYL